MILNSRVDAVTVFLDRAKVVRSAAAELPAGESVLVFENIPSNIQPDSVRARGTGAGVRIRSLDVAKVHLSKSPDALVAEVQKQIEGLELQAREAADAQALLESRLKTTAQMRVSAATDLVKGLAWGRTGIEAISAFTAQLDGSDETARASIRELEVRSRAVARELEAARARLKQLQQPASRQRQEIRVAVESDTAANPCEIQISYVCSGASWKPLYDLRLSGHQLQVTYLASVTQETGESWDGVDLSLSTARPATTFAIPELSPWYLDVPRPAPVPAGMYRAALGGPPGAPQAMGEMAMMSMAAPAAAAPPPPPMEVIQADVSTNQGGASVSFRIPRKASVPSDRTPHRLQIAEFELPVTLDYVTAPKVAEQAYLRAKVRNDSPFVLLPGRANLFHGDEFVGATEIEDTAAAEFELQMGVDERVTVCRELVSREVSKAFIGNTRKASYAYRIRIANKLQSSAKLLVIDQLPHALHEDIKVKLVDAVPKASEVLELGELRWQLDLAPGKETVVQFGFAVEYPRHMTVLGLAD